MLRALASMAAEREGPPSVYPAETAPSYGAFGDKCKAIWISNIVGGGDGSVLGETITAMAGPRPLMIRVCKVS